MLFSILKSAIGGPSTGTLIKYGVILAIISSAVVYHFFTVSSLKTKYIERDEEISTLRLNALQSAANDTLLRQEIVDIMQDRRRVKDQRRSDQLKITRLNKSFVKTQSEVNGLRKLLSKHNLSMLALEKPGLLERRINAATAKIGKEIEELTRLIEENLP